MPILAFRATFVIDALESMNSANTVVLTVKNAVSIEAVLDTVFHIHAALII